MIRLSTIGLLLLALRPANAQSPAPTLFLEAGGLAAYYSVNYGHPLFGTESLQGYLRIGAGIWKDEITFPVGLSLLVGKTDHRLEITPALGLHFEGLQFWDRDRSDLLLDLVLGLAYRYQPADKWYFLSVGAFPYLELDPTSSQLSEKAAQLGFRPGLSFGAFF